MKMHQRMVVLTCATLACVACNGGGGSEYVTELPPVRATAEPECEVPPTAAPRPQQKPSEVAIHLDISYPMGGFLPPEANSNELSALRLIAQNVAQHMKRRYGGPNVPVKWYGVGHEVRELSPSPRIQRGLFDGRSTRLDLSIKKILSDIESGYIEAAAIVTDLMATADVTGPSVVSAQLKEWLDTDEVWAGEFHVGLFGVKAEYWGVTHSPECPPGSRLGCWFDERVQKYKPLKGPSFLPFYVLVIGRGAEAVTSAMEKCEQVIRQMNQPSESQWELLTRNSRSFDTSLSCEIVRIGDNGKRERQYALQDPDGDGIYTCFRDTTVTLDCAFGESEDSLMPTRALATWSSRSTGGADPPEPAVRVDQRDRRIEIDVDCSAIRANRAGLQLALDVFGSANRLTEDWRGWSTEVGELGKTMDLDGFVQEVRITPDCYRVELPTILRLSGE